MLLWVYHIPTSLMCPTSQCPCCILCPTSICPCYVFVFQVCACPCCLLVRVLHPCVCPSIPAVPRSIPLPMPVPAAVSLCARPLPLFPLPSPHRGAALGPAAAVVVFLSSGTSHEGDGRIDDVAEGGLYEGDGVRQRRGSLGDGGAGRGHLVRLPVAVLRHGGGGAGEMAAGPERALYACSAAPGACREV